MIFGLFKKDESADLVFFNGKVYTQNPDYPWAEAVACKGNKIIYVGSGADAENFIGSDTCVIDMNDGVLLPGLINTHSHPVQRALEGVYIPLYEEWDIEDVLGALSDYIFEHQDQESYFGYGFDASILDGMGEDEIKKLLDECYNDKPVVLLSAGEEKIWINSCAYDAVVAAAQEDGVSMVTISYLMHVLAPFDYDEVLSKVASIVTTYSQKGFTGIFNAGAPEFMNQIYQQILASMFQQELLKQRNFDSFQVIKSAVPERSIQQLIQKRTNATELDDIINCEVLKLIVKSNQDECSISPVILKQLMMEASDKGFNLHIDVEGKVAFVECLKVIAEVRNAGYRKNNFTIACEPELLANKESLEDISFDNVYFQPSTLYEPDLEYAALEGANSVEEIINRFTIDAAIALGVNDKLGTIEKGKLADLTLFSENPFQLMKPALFKKLNAAITVMNGEIVYDAEEENMTDLYNLMSAQQL